VEILELSDADIDEIRHIPYERLARAAQQAGKELGYPAGLMLFEPSPTENFYTGLSNVVGFREETRQIPVIAGTVLGEFSFSHDLGDKSRYSEEEKRKILEKTFGGRYGTHRRPVSQSVSGVWIFCMPSAWIHCSGRGQCVSFVSAPPLPMRPAIIT
jgi:hypothetical protein